MVIFAARPSHGKSAVALQVVHHLTSMGTPCAIISEEMSAHALGKRTLQFITSLPSEHWRGCADVLETEIDEYSMNRAPAFIVEGCGTAARAAEQVAALVKTEGVKCVVVDYAQLLQSPGKDRYQQTSATSIALRQMASAHNLLLIALCQLSRSIDSRDTFIPRMSDLKDTGQLEQDADVIIFLVWPWKVDAGEPKNRYQFFVAKNRNRQINQEAVEAHFDPSRQMLSDQVREVGRYENTRDGTTGARIYGAGGEGDIPD